jgi:hypothetical protein
MGIEVTDEEQLRWLEKKGYLEVSPKLEIRNGRVLVHASENASKINKIEGGIIFSKRKDYEDRIRNNFSIKGGYKVKPFEHIDIETVECFKLSEYVGIHFHNNPAQQFLRYVRRNSKSIKRSIENLDLTDMIDGWVDPNYSGPFSRQPKWYSPINIKPGDVIGEGVVIFFPNGVETGYGSAKLGSQYKDAKATAISK